MTKQAYICLLVPTSCRYMIDWGLGTGACLSGFLYLQSRYCLKGLCAAILTMTFIYSGLSEALYNQNTPASDSPVACHSQLISAPKNWFVVLPHQDIVTLPIYNNASIVTNIEVM